MDLSKRKILWLDTETTGLDCSANFAHQISYILTDGPEKVIVERNLKMLPDNLSDFVIEEKALAVSGLKPEDIMGYPKESEQLPILLNDLNTAIKDGSRLCFAAYNALFDIGFIAKALERSAAREKAHYDWGTFFDSSYDVLLKVRQLRRDHKLELENCRQPTVAAYFGIEGDFHDALVDIRTCREIYLRLRKEGMI